MQVPHCYLATGTGLCLAAPDPHSYILDRRSTSTGPVRFSLTFSVGRRMNHWKITSYDIYRINIRLNTCQKCTDKVSATYWIPTTEFILNVVSVSHNK